MQATRMFGVKRLGWMRRSTWRLGRRAIQIVIGGGITDRNNYLMKKSMPPS